MTDILDQTKKPDFMYEDLHVFQIDLVKHPATRDKFLAVRSEDGTTITNVPIIRSELAKVVDKKSEILNELGEDEMSEKLSEIIDKVSASTEKLERMATSLFADVIEKQNDGKVDEEVKTEDVETTEAKSDEEIATEEVPVETDEDKSEETVGAKEETSEDVTEEAPVEAETVEDAPVAATDDAPAEVEQEVAMRDILNKFNEAVGNLTDKLEGLSDRVKNVERSALVPSAQEKDETQEKAERSKKSVFHGLIK